MTGAASSQVAGPPSASLAVLPFIEAMYPSGRRALLSLTQVLEQAGRARLATTDLLLWAATARLLTAVAYAAGCGPSGRQEYWHQVRHGINLEPAVRWVRGHAADLDLFHPRKPLFQDGSLHAVVGPDAGVPVQYLDLAAAIRRPLLSDHRHLYVRELVSAARAAQLLLVQQMWCLGGRISASESVYGKGCNYGRPATACGGLVMQPDGPVAQMLAWRLIPLPGGRTGTAHWTYTPREALVPLSDGADGEDGLVPDGEVDALTWHHRRILLIPRPDGSVERAMFAQGWPPIAGAKHLPVTERPGSRDMATTEAGHRLHARSVTSEEDLAPLLHSWWTAPEGSWTHAARQAAAAGSPLPDVRVTGLNVHTKKKIENLRHVFLPGSLLADLRGKRAAATIMRVRQRTRTAAPGFGSTHLSQETFMNATDQAQEHMLVTRPLPDPTRLPAVLDESLFTTTDSPFDERAENLDDRDDPVFELTRKFGAWARSSYTRDLMEDLRRWAVQPSPSNPAYPRVTRLVPDEWHYAGMLTASLFATHQRLQRSAATYGQTPLPRLMRAFGTRNHLGSRHRPTRAAMTLMLRVPRAEDLRPLLLSQIRYAAAHQMTPRWNSLMYDLAGWGPVVQEHWHAQFYCRRPLPPGSAKRSSPTWNGAGTT
ncbi:type I-E CRISPR-associated protein Cse1/CasA [Streptomyces sp. NPDC056831]|uniref:type I-E CRISPR-associated protein Cse1/CasA n=1 Tax=Streptomyces sp. NPDC056831 TaxID=3345954 RepID=UPI00367A5CE8